MSAAAPNLGVPADDLLGLALLGKTALALGLVVACVLLCGWLLARLGARSAAPGQMVQVVGSSRLGQRERVVVVDVCGRRLVLGVTAQQVTCLAQMDVPVAAGNPSAPPAGGFARRLAVALQQGLGGAEPRP